jgi:hypothetical protein
MQSGPFYLQINVGELFHQIKRNSFDPNKQFSPKSPLAN